MAASTYCSWVAPHEVTSMQHPHRAMRSMLFAGCENDGIRDDVVFDRLGRGAVDVAERNDLPAAQNLVDTAGVIAPDCAELPTTPILTVI